MAANLKIGADVGDVKPLKAFTRAIKDQAKAIRDYTAASNAAPKGGVGYGSASARSLQTRAPRATTGGPFSRHAGAQNQMARAMASGDPMAIMDAMHNLKTASKAVTRAQRGMQPPSFGQKLNSWGRSTRVGAGGAMPLLGQSLDLVGLGAMAGPIGIATTAIVAMGKAAMFASEYLHNMQVDQVAFGGKQAEKRAASVGFGAGASPEELKKLGKAAQAATYDGSNAGAKLRQFGMSNPGFGANRNPDVAAVGVEALKALRAMPEKERLRTMQDLGAEAFGPLLNKPKEVQDRAMSGRMGDPAHRAAKALPWVGDWLTEPHKVGSLQWTLQKLGKMALGPIGYTIPDESYGASLGGPNGQQKQEEQTSALNANTQALVKMATLMERQIFGGGAQAQGAIPKHWNWETMNDIAGAKEAYALGAFGL